MSGEIHGMLITTEPRYLPSLRTYNESYTVVSIKRIWRVRSPQQIIQPAHHRASALFHILPIAFHHPREELRVEAIRMPASYMLLDAISLGASLILLLFRIVWGEDIGVDCVRCDVLWSRWLLDERPREGDPRKALRLLQGLPHLLVTSEEALDVVLGEHSRVLRLFPNEALALESFLLTPKLFLLTACILLLASCPLAFVHGRCARWSASRSRRRAWC